MKLRSTFYSLIVLVLLSAAASAQTLTVREIMAEPSIAGQRVEGERLSPDGSKVIFLWNAEGKLPRDLYMVSTSGGTPEIILRVSDMPVGELRLTPPNKLDYGVEMRDAFVRARENTLGGFEWSPDSRKLVFSYIGDLYVLHGEAPSSPTRYLENLKGAALRLSDVVADIFVRVGTIPNDYKERFDRLREQNAVLRSKATSGSMADDIVNSARLLGETFGQIFPATEPPQGYVSRKNVLDKVEEFYGTQNRLNVARMDYNDWFQRSKPKRYTKTQSPEFGARFLDGERILYSSGGNAFVLNISDATTIQLTRESNPTAFVSVGNIVPNKAGTTIAYVVSDSSKFKPLVVPNYLPDFVTTANPRRGWSEQKLFVTPADGTRETPFEVKLPKQEGVGGVRRMVWAADGRSLIVDRVDKDTKRRQLFYIYNAGGKDEQQIMVSDETDDKWQASLSVIFEPNPANPKQLFFCSEKSGYNHFNIANIDLAGRADVKQVTNGNWQVEWAKWTPDGSNIVFTSTEPNPAQRKFYSFNIGRALHVELGSVGDGMITNPQLAEQGDQPMLIFGFSKWNMPDELYSMPACFNCRGIEASRPLTKTAPATFSKRPWSVPKFIDIPSRDGKVIKSKIYLPAGHDPKKKYPMAIFVHGAGYLQNTINGWNNYYREFMFNDLLAKKGYVVLDIDYRGSAGYGRDWRTDVYDFLGGKDYEDHIDAIDHMVKNYGVNQSKIGVYGGSYGGFMAGMLAMRAPERIAAAAALRPVFDWKNYYASSPQYTAQRLGFPDKNPEAYKRSSPISYADKLERPLLILHGMSDDNVHVQDSVQLIEKLIRLGKTQYFEAMLYPSENHAFVRPESWADEYERILALFEKHLK